MIIILSLCVSLLLMGEAAAGAIEVLPIAGALGAEIAGVDLASDLSDATVGAIRRAWLEHLVVFFRDQTLAPHDLQAFARGHQVAARDGELRRHLAQRHRVPGAAADGDDAGGP